MNEVGIKDLQSQLSDELAKKLKMYVEGNQIVIEPLEWLKDDYGKVNELVQKYGGRYHRADEGGKFAKKFTVPTSTPQKQSELAEIVDEFERLLTRLRKVAY